MIPHSQMTWKPAGFCRVGPADGITEEQMPEPCRVVRCWRGADDQLWVEELVVPPGKPGLVMALQMWIAQHGYLSAAIQPEPGKTVLLSRHPRLKYTPVDPPVERGVRWLRVATPPVRKLKVR